MIVITGATGLLGSHLIEKFTAEGIPLAGLCREGRASQLPGHVQARTGDLLDEPSLREAFEGADAVIHAGALVSFNPRLKNQLYEVNVEGTRNVVNTCLQLGIPRLIHISSVAALGRRAGEITNESSQGTGEDSSYGMSKYMAELEVFRGIEEGLGACIVNPSVILSASRPGQSSSALFDYVWEQRKFYVEGLLNYVDGRDVAEAVLRLFRQAPSCERFILNAGEVPLQTFFSMIAERLQRTAPSVKVSPKLLWWVGFLEELRGLISGREPMVTRESARLATQQFRYDSRKAVDRLGMAFHPLDESLDWCCEQYRRYVNANNQ